MVTSVASCLCGVRGCDGKQCNPISFENGKLRQELRIAEEGLANYAQEVEQLKAERDRWKKRADELFFAESPGHPSDDP